MNKIVIITYNILSSNLATLMIDNKIYPEAIMNVNYRLDNIIKYLEQQLIKFSKYNLIICLQEVVEEQLGILSNFFNKFNYKFINAQHGRVNNGNMGVLIAYPTKLQLNNSELFTVGKHIKISDDTSIKASTKSNIAIFAIFEDIQNKLKFGIITYHMPCEPTIPMIALLHCKTLYTHIKEFMKNINWIFAGDFNMTPDTIAYNYMINKLNLGCIWKDLLNFYPKTNHAFIQNKEFSGCIDYIFYKKGHLIKNDTHIKYKKSNLICTKIKLKKLNNIIPDKYEPSDHLPILSIFNLNK